MESRRGPWSPAFTVLALALGHVPAYVAAGAAAATALVLAALLLAPDPRSVPQRMLLLICLLQRADPEPWFDPPRTTRAAGAPSGGARQTLDGGRDTAADATCGKAGDGRGADTEF